jgi:hypothetical protein
MKIRNVVLVLLVTVGLGVALLDRHGAPRSPANGSISVGEQHAERILTLLDVWTQTLVPTILLQQSRAHALRVGNLSRAARLGPRIERGLVQAEGFESAAQNPKLRDDNAAALRALRAAGAAWAAWASALLGQSASVRGNGAAHTAQLEARAIRLHQAAYDAVDASLTAVGVGRQVRCNIGRGLVGSADEPLGQARDRWSHPPVETGRTNAGSNDCRGCCP